MELKEYIKRESGVEGEWKNARDISTFKGGGRAFVFRPKSVDETMKIVKILRDENIGFSMLGKGSNTLVCDGDCVGVLISLSKMNKVEIEGETSVCEGGASVRKIVETGRKFGLGGLEFLSGVPCSIGGAIKMNAGAFLHETHDYVTKICILNIDNANCDKIRIEEICAADVNFGYRKGVSGIVLKARLKLANKTAEESLLDAQTFLSKRREKQPALPSLGSVFKNGVVPSGKVIDSCGLKGVGIGGAKVSDMHANFIVNTGGATAKDYLDLANFCKKEVYEKTGIRLEEEFVKVE